MEAPTGYVIQLAFTSFDIEDDSTCGYDWVEVSYESYNEKFCGSSNPGQLTSFGPTMTVRMHTDSSVTRTGFRAIWTAVTTYSIMNNILDNEGKETRQVSIKNLVNN